MRKSFINNVRDHLSDKPLNYQAGYLRGALKVCKKGKNAEDLKVMIETVNWKIDKLDKGA